MSQTVNFLSLFFIFDVLSDRFWKFFQFSTENRNHLKYIKIHVDTCQNVDISICTKATQYNQWNIKIFLQTIKISCLKYRFEICHNSNLIIPISQTHGPIITVPSSLQQTFYVFIELWKVQTGKSWPTVYNYGTHGTLSMHPYISFLFLLSVRK